MDLLERVEQLERELKARRPDLHFPSTATLEQRLRWLEIVLEEMRARDNYGVYAETLTEEKLRQIVGHSTIIKGDRITKHSLTADPASCATGDTWFRSDLGKIKLAIDAVVANAKPLRREGDTIPADEIAALDAGKITSGRFGMTRMPDGDSGKVLTAQGAAADPAYAAIAGLPTIVRKTANEGVYGSTTLQDDDHLFLAVAANEKWLVEFIIYASPPSEYDTSIKLAVTVPAGASIIYGLTHQAPAATTASDMMGTTSGAAISVRFLAVDTVRLIRLLALVSNGATAGYIRLQWAQHTFLSATTLVLANSCLIAYKLG